MSVIKVFRDLDGLFNYSADKNPTSQQDYQEAVKNWVKTIVSLVDSNLWQPKTEYTVGDTVKTPSLSKDTVLYCLKAGTTGAAEPDYTDMGIGDEITDGTVTWSLIQPIATVGRIEERIGSTEQRIDSLQNRVDKAEKRGVLPGTVTAFSGTFKDGYPVNKNTGLVDKEWYLCDGTNGTPDLRNRFIYGGNGTNNGTTGGEEKHKLTTSEMPAHNHTMSSAGEHDHKFEGAKSSSDNRTTKYENTGDYGRTRAWLQTNYTQKSGSHTHTINSAGGGEAHNNMPPYYVLAFIMKL